MNGKDPIFILDDGETWGGPGYISFIDSDQVDAGGGYLPESLPVLPFSVEWGDEDEAVANKEGWTISQCYGSAALPDGAYDIQKLDEADIFHEDAAAIAHVYWGATAGSPLHARALARCLFQPALLKAEVHVSD